MTTAWRTVATRVTGRDVDWWHWRISGYERQQHDAAVLAGRVTTMQRREADGSFVLLAADVVRPVMRVGAGVRFG